MLECITHSEIYSSNLLDEYTEFKDIWEDRHHNRWKMHLPVEIEYICSLLHKHYVNKSRIRIVDDIDFDGVSSATVSMNYLKPLFTNVDVYSTIEHGINQEIIRGSSSIDLLIIVDGGTNLEEVLKGLECDVLIIDHHSPDPDLPSHVIYQTEIKGKIKTLVNCNSKYTKDLVSISAGMLCYIVFHTFYRRIVDGHYDETGTDGRRKRLKPELDYFEIGAVSLISDIVPIDEYVMRTLIHYFERYAGSSEFVRDLLAGVSGIVNMKNLQWECFPLINYTKRLKDSNAISMIYKYGVQYTSKLLNENRTSGRGVVDTIELYGEKRKFTNFYYIDTTMLYEIYNIDISNFKGLMCNRVSAETLMPTIVGIDKIIDGKSITEVSVRSQGYNSLIYFKTLNYVKGDGHPSACGFKVETERLAELLDGYDKYLGTSRKIAENIISIAGNDDLFAMDLHSLAVYNYLAISNLRQIKVVINDFNSNDIFMMTQNKGVLRQTDIELTGPIGGRSVCAKPILENFQRGKFYMELENYTG